MKINLMFDCCFEEDQNGLAETAVAQYSAMSPNFTAAPVLSISGPQQNANREDVRAASASRICGDALFGT